MLFCENLELKARKVSQYHGNGKEHVWFRFVSTSIPGGFRRYTESNCNSGKGIGGSTAVNFMGWFKPPKEELDGMRMIARVVARETNMFLLQILRG